ncbi:hypothetical protein [Sphingobacterium multivorum]|uniref:Uncharacterized protein n=1 Tax=Sphingobacterium multivorum TaxID=28454 RepID=A0A653YQ91_SPHMU|nr:hypothetical protein [Sphingobacterium multivorum]VXC44472.1 conserved hypothetical protein [Sphingobacterium multivorum]
MEQKFGWIAKVFSDVVGLFDTKGKAAIQVIMIAAIIYLYIENQNLNGQISKEIRLSGKTEAEIYKKLLERYDPAFREIKEKADSSNAIVDTLRGQIKPLVHKLSEKLKSME